MNRSPRGGRTPASWITNAFNGLQELCSDPWLSSLRTLHEAFLRGDAFFLSKKEYYMYPSTPESKFSWVVDGMRKEVCGPEGLLNACETIRLCTKEIYCSTALILPTSGIQSGRPSI